MVIIFAFAIGILMIGYAIAYYIISVADNKEKKETNELGELNTVKSFNLKSEEFRDEHNMTLLLNLIEGNTKMGSTVLLLHPVKMHYKYYHHEDLIIYVSDYMWKKIGEMGYKIKNDSANNLIISYE